MFRYSLRTFFIVITILCLLSGWCSSHLPSFLLGWNGTDNTEIDWQWVSEFKSIATGADFIKDCEEQNAQHSNPRPYGVVLSTANPKGRDQSPDRLAYTIGRVLSWVRFWA